jgi:hypothetical protein
MDIFNHKGHGGETKDTKSKAPEVRHLYSKEFHCLQVLAEEMPIRGMKVRQNGWIFF